MLHTGAQDRHHRGQLDRPTGATAQVLFGGLCRALPTESWSRPDRADDRGMVVGADV
jgi:hypothetical protein